METTLLEKLIEKAPVVFFESADQEHVINSLAIALSSSFPQLLSELIVKAVGDRELVASTGIGCGVAIPHARMLDGDDFYVAIGISEGAGIEWNSIDDEGVHIIIMLCGPKNAQSEYLQLLSDITRSIQSETVRKKMVQSQTPRGVIDALLKSDEETKL